MGVEAERPARHGVKHLAALSGVIAAEVQGLKLLHIRAGLPDFRLQSWGIGVSRFSETTAYWLKVVIHPALMVLPLPE